MGGAVLSAAMIAWAQSQIEGIPAQNYNQIAEGLTWQWSGEAASLASRPGAQLLTNIISKQEVAGAPVPAGRPRALVPDPSFAVTDGARLYGAHALRPNDVQAPLLVFADAVPPKGTPLTIVQADPAALHTDNAAPELLCLTPGTLVDTTAGRMKIEDIQPGTRVRTRDSGAQEVIWIGHRVMSGARLFAQPHDRPIRIRQGAMHGAGPFRDLLVSPDHRILRRSDAAHHLWNEREVLVRAADLRGQPGVSVAPCLTGTRYVTLMLENHEVIWANGLEVETFHPGTAGLNRMTPGARGSLLSVRPDLAPSSDRYGPNIRRTLTRAKAAILGYGDTRRNA